MAILSEYNEEINQKKSTSYVPSEKKEFNAALDPSNPLGFLEKVFEFLAKESDVFRSNSRVNYLNAIVRMMKEKVAAEEKKRRVEGKDTKVEKNMSSKKSDESKVEEEKDGPRAPNKINGLDMEKYSWGQSLQEVNITVPVPMGTKASSVVVEMKPKHIKIGLKNQPPVIEGELFQAAKVEDSFWSLEDQISISILLTKQNQMDWWKYLVKGEPEINTQKTEPETSKLSDLDPETRASVEKVMFDQRQKQMGKPTSDEIQKKELLKKIMTENPNMDFSGFGGSKPL